MCIIQLLVTFDCKLCTKTKHVEVEVFIVETYVVIDDCNYSYSGVVVDSGTDL